jgi:hypothetical protein
MDRGEIEQQLQDIGEGSRWWDVRELRDLPSVLRDDEHILAIARGKVTRLRWVRPSWLIVVTGQRLLFLRSHAHSGWRHAEVNAQHIERLALRIGPFRGRVMVAASGVTHRIVVPRPEAYRLHAALSSLGPVRAPAVSGFGATRVARRIVDHVLALPAAALRPENTNRVAPPRPDTSRLEQRLETVEAELQQLQQQVDFLEDLLRTRHTERDTTRG